jgi:hypothetical protein
MRSRKRQPAFKLETLFESPWAPHRLDLTGASSSFQVEWHNVASGMIAKADAVTGGAKRLHHPPFTGAAVLFLHRPRQP